MVHALSFVGLTLRIELAVFDQDIVIWRQGGLVALPLMGQCLDVLLDFVKLGYFCIFQE